MLVISPGKTKSPSNSTKLIGLLCSSRIRLRLRVRSLAVPVSWGCSFLHQAAVLRIALALEEAHLRETISY
jgi:hypothetical protein